MQTVRIRNKAKVTQLDISDEKKDCIKFIKERTFDRKRRASNIKDILGHSLCITCSEVPSIQVSYDLGGFRRMEYYCDSCIAKVYERDEPEDRNELAAKYNCIIGKLPETPGYKEGKEVLK